VPNVAAILLGRVDLRVDRQQFRNNIKIQDSLSAVSHASHSRSGTGRHGGRPSQEQEANIPAVPDDTEVIPPKCQKRISQRYRTTRRSSLPNARSEYRSGTGRHGGHPSQMPEANIVAVPDDTEVIPPKCPEANAAAVPDDTEVVPPKCQKRIS
jgi:hypothetical protein